MMTLPSALITWPARVHTAIACLWRVWRDREGGGGGGGCIGSDPFVALCHLVAGAGVMGAV